MSAPKRSSRGRARSREAKSQWPVSTHLRVAQTSIAAAPAAALARQLSHVLLTMAEELGDPSISKSRRKWLEDHIEQLWHHAIFPSENLDIPAQIATLVDAVAVSARALEEDVEGRTLYLHAGLLHFHTRFPGRCTRLTESKATANFHAAVLVWNARGRNAGKWQAIAKLAASIGFHGDPEQIRRIWVDARRREARKMRGTTTTD